MSEPPHDRAERQGSTSVEPCDLDVEEVTLDANTPNDVAKAALQGEQLKTIIGLIIGFLVIVLGAVLVVLGFKGTVNLGLEVGDIKAHVVTGSLGIVLAFIGVGVVWLTKYKVTTTSQRAKTGRQTKGSI